MQGFIAFWQLFFIVVWVRNESRLSLSSEKSCQCLLSASGEQVPAGMWHWIWFEWIWNENGVIAEGQSPWPCSYEMKTISTLTFSGQIRLIMSLKSFVYHDSLCRRFPLPTGDMSASRGSPPRSWRAGPGTTSSSGRMRSSSKLYSVWTDYSHFKW